MLSLEDRGYDWWFFTLVPLMFSFIAAGILYFLGTPSLDVIIFLVEQIIVFSLILSTTDLGIRFKNKKANQEPIGKSLLQIFLGLFLLVVFYIHKPAFITKMSHLVLFSIIAVAFLASVVIYYNHNENASDKTSEDMKEDGDKNYSQFAARVEEQKTEDIKT